MNNISKSKISNIFTKKYISLIAILIFVYIVYLTHAHNYLLFHTLTGLFSILIAYGIFIFAWNTRLYIENKCFLFLGVAYMFVGNLEMLHILTYPGINIFKGTDINLATQFWISARYLESISLFIAPIFAGRNISIKKVFYPFIIGTLILAGSIFYWKIFPICFIEGVGVTPFKRNSEYIIIITFLSAAYLFWKKQNRFNKVTLNYLFNSIIFSALSESCFIFHFHAYGFPNLIGYLLQLLSFYYIYKAIIENSLLRPYENLFQNLKNKKAELKKEKDRAETYFDLAGSIMVIIDPKQKVKLLNKKARDILGCEQKDILGKNWFDTYIPESDRDNIKNAFKRLIANGTDSPDSIETHILTHTGESKTIAWHHAILKDGEDNIIGILSSGEDITERKKAEDILKRDKHDIEKLIKERTDELLKTQKKLDDIKRLSDIGTLVTTIAHELRNPLGIISVAAYNIKRKRQNPLIDKHLSNIEKKVFESDKIISSLLTYSNIKIPSYEKIKIRDILEECVSSSKYKFQNYQVLIIPELESIKDIIIDTDPLQIKEIFNNILDNAYQSFPQKKGKIKISANVHENENIFVSFEDNGPGIDKSDLPKVLNPFYTRKPKGTGLGLTICNELISLHGGEIDIKSPQNLGVKVTIQIPIKRKI